MRNIRILIYIDVHKSCVNSTISSLMSNKRFPDSIGHVAFATYYPSVQIC